MYMVQHMYSTQPPLSHTHHSYTEEGRKKGKEATSNGYIKPHTHTHTDEQPNMARPWYLQTLQLAQMDGRIQFNNHLQNKPSYDLLALQYTIV